MEEGCGDDSGVVARFGCVRGGEGCGDEGVEGAYPGGGRGEVLRVLVGSWIVTQEGICTSGGIRVSRSLRKLSTCNRSGFSMLEIPEHSSGRKVFSLSSAAVCEALTNAYNSTCIAVSCSTAICTSGDRSGIFKITSAPFLPVEKASSVCSTAAVVIGELQHQGP